MMILSNAEPDTVSPAYTTEVDTLQGKALIRFTANDIYQTSAPRVVRRPILLLRGAQLSCSAVVAEGTHPAAVLQRKTNRTGFRQEVQ